MVTDPYFYLGTNVLKDLAGIEDYDQLQLFEAVSTADRILELHVSPITRRAQSKEAEFAY